MSKIYEKAMAYTKKYGPLLAPCKYCRNHDVRIWVDREIFGSGYMWSVNCMTPNCDFTYDRSVKAAIDRWNERHAAKVKEEKG